MNKNWILYDGKFHPADVLLFDTADLSSVLFTEKIRSVRNRLPFWEEHLHQIQRKIQLLSQPIPTYLQNDGKELKRQTERFLSKNKLFKSALLKIQFLLKQSGLSYLISHTEISDTHFALNKNGHILEVFDQIRKPASPVSTHFNSEPIWEIVNRQILPKTISALLISNTNGNILELPEKNIYLVKGNKISTPSETIGAFIGVSHNTIRKIALNLGFEFIETDQLKQAAFLEADEVFLASGIRGIEWVKGFYNKRYFSKTVRKISDEFNRELIQ